MSCRNRGNANCGWPISSFGFDGNITLVAGSIPGVAELMTGILASGEPALVCFDCCRVTIVAIDSGSSDHSLATVKSPVVFDDAENSFLCPGGGGSVDGVPVRSIKVLAKRMTDELWKKRTADERSDIVLRALGIEPLRASGHNHVGILSL
jgi:hypothetical protein